MLSVCSIVLCVLVGILLCVDVTVVDVSGGGALLSVVVVVVLVVDCSDVRVSVMVVVLVVAPLVDGGSTVVVEVVRLESCGNVVVYMAEELVLLVDGGDVASFEVVVVMSPGSVVACVAARVELGAWLEPSDWPEVPAMAGVVVTAVVMVELAVVGTAVGGAGGGKK